MNELTKLTYSNNTSTLLSGFVIVYISMSCNIKNKPIVKAIVY